MTGERIAILVIHGIGEQEPYETLDAFTRGLLSSLRDKNHEVDWTIQPDLQSATDPSHQQTNWVQASIELNASPPYTVGILRSIAQISTFEYYWAPITQDKITYSGSLNFLIRAGLQPFLYLAANVNAIRNSKASDGTKALAGGTSSTVGRETILIFWRELSRQVKLFLPLIALFVGLLIWLNGELATGLKKSLLALSADLPTIATVALFAIRFLYVYMAWNALRVSLMKLPTNTVWQSKWGWRSLLIGILTIAVLGPVAVELIIDGLRGAANIAGVLQPGKDLIHCAINLLHKVSFLGNLPDYLGIGLHGLHTLLRNISWTHSKSGAVTGSFKALRWFLFFDPMLSRFFGKIVLVLLALAVRYILVDYVGDVAVYANASALARNFAARSQILQECTSMLSSLLLAKDDRNNPRFDRVLIAAHSLGTVIAYDTVNAILNRARVSTPGAGLQPSDLVRFTGLITFGSPLNKIYYFFREQVDAQATLRKQLLSLLYDFRIWKGIDNYPPDQEFEQVHNPQWHAAEQALEYGLVWINAYAHQDPISGRLLFYDLKGSDNQRAFPYLVPGLAHTSYWRDPNFYDWIVAKLF